MLPVSLCLSDAALRLPSLPAPPLFVVQQAANSDERLASLHTHQLYLPRYQSLPGLGTASGGTVPPPPSAAAAEAAAADS